MQQASANDKGEYKIIIHYFSDSCNNIYVLWKEYKKVLIEYFVDYSDTNTFTEFMKNDALRNTVEKEFESRIS